MMRSLNDEKKELLCVAARTSLAMTADVQLTFALRARIAQRIRMPLGDFLVRHLRHVLSAEEMNKGRRFRRPNMGG